MKLHVWLAVAILLLCSAVPAVAQMQIDPNVPTNIPPADQDDFKGFLDVVMDSIIAANGAVILDAGRQLWRGLAAMVVVWTGLRIAMSGSFQLWEVIQLIIGLWIPWAMLNFYADPLPPPAGPFTFPGVIVGGGNWLMDFFISDIGTAMQTELSIMVDQHTTHVTDAWAGAGWYDVVTAGMGAFATLIIGTTVMTVVMLCLLVLYAVTYAQVIWAQVAIAILIFVGPLFIPWLVFEPLSFLFWGWFRSMIVFSLYGVMAGAIMRVFLGVGLGYVTSFSSAAINLDSPNEMTGWLLIVLPLMVAGVLASLKVGELAGMLVTGTAGGGGGLTAVVMMAASGGKAALAGKAGGLK